MKLKKRSLQLAAIVLAFLMAFPSAAWATLSYQQTEEQTVEAETILMEESAETKKETTELVNTETTETTEVKTEPTETATATETMTETTAAEAVSTDAQNDPAEEQTSVTEQTNTEISALEEESADLPSEEESAADQPETETTELSEEAESEELLKEETEMDPAETRAEEAAEEAEAADEKEDDLSVFEAEAQPFVYNGDTVTFIKADGSAFGMFAAQEGTNAVINGDMVEITYFPKQSAKYLGFHFGDISISESWDNYQMPNSDGSYTIILAKDFCGKAWPVVPVSASTGKPGGTQYYLAIPSADKLPEIQNEAQPFVYDGDDLNFIKKDNTAFAMFAPLEGTKAIINGNNVKITYYPKQSSKYAGFYFGDITVPANWNNRQNPNSDGSYSIILDKSFCGQAWPVAIVKSDNSTTKDQMYLAIPSADKLSEEEEKPEDPETPEDPTEVQPFDYDGDDVTFIKVDKSEFGMFRPQEGTEAKINGDNVEITYFPKNTTTYVGFYFGDISKSDGWKDKQTPNSDGSYSITLTKDHCGKAWPVAPVKEDDTTTTSQFYLAIPTEDKLMNPEGSDKPEDPKEPSKDDTGSETEKKSLMITKSDGTEYGMLRVTDYTAETDGKNITITFFTNHETYAKKIYLGTTKEIGSIKQAYSRAKDTSFTITVPYKDKGKKLPMVIATEKGWKDEQYYIQIPDDLKETKEPVKEAAQEENKDNTAYKPENNANTANGTTAPVNNTTGLTDGTYTPDSFSFAGGTGRLTITCTQITIRGGKAYATLQFNSGKIIYVKAAGATYYPVAQTANSSTYEIPVELNVNQQIIGCTTAMSQPHEVTYTIFVGLQAAAAAKPAQEGEEVKAEDGSTLIYRNNAPEVPGLTYLGTLKTESAEYFRLHYYEDGFKVLQIGTGEEAPDWDQLNPDMDKEEQAQPENSQAAAPEAEETEESASQEEPESLYDGDILTYILVPEEKEIPAGIEKEMIVISTPVQNACVFSQAPLAMIAGENLTDPVKSVSADLSENENLQDALDDDKIAVVENLENKDYRSLLLSGAEVAIVSCKDLTAAAEENETARDQITAYGDDLDMLGIVLLPDRSQEEKEEAGAAEWKAVYTSILSAEATE